MVLVSCCEPCMLGIGQPDSTQVDNTSGRVPPDPASSDQTSACSRESQDSWRVSVWVVRAAMYWSQPPSTTRESTLIVLLSSGRRQWRDCAHSSNRRTRSKAPTHGSSAFDDTRNTLMTKPNLSSNDIREEISEEMRADYLRQAQRLADECRSIIKREVGGGRLETTVKQDGSLVSSGDKAAEKAFRERVHGLFPDAGIIGDEYYHSNPNPKADFQWIIDPIDEPQSSCTGYPSMEQSLLSTTRGSLSSDS